MKICNRIMCNFFLSTAGLQIRSGLNFGKRNPFQINIFSQYFFKKLFLNIHISYIRFIKSKFVGSGFEFFFRCTLHYIRIYLNIFQSKFFYHVIKWKSRASKQLTLILYLLYEKANSNNKFHSQSVHVRLVLFNINKIRITERAL